MVQGLPGWEGGIEFVSVVRQYRRIPMHDVREMHHAYKLVDQVMFCMWTQLASPFCKRHGKHHTTLRGIRHIIFRSI